MNGKRAKALRRVSKMYAEKKGFPEDQLLRNRRTKEVAHSRKSEVGWYRLLKKESKMDGAKPTIDKVVHVANIQKSIPNKMDS